MKDVYNKAFIAVVAMFLFSNIASGQTTAFNFQGRLNDGTNPANGRYDLQFKLFDAITGGNQVGTTLDQPNKVLVNGVFSTVLDFGASAFTGGNRFIEISVRPNGSPNPHVILGTRQQIMSVPFAVRSANATQADNADTADFATLAGNSISLGGVGNQGYARLDFLNSGGLRATGNAGFGPVAPNTRLTLSGGAPWSSNGWTASMNMQNASALGWEANASGQRFGIGQSTNGLHFFRTISGFGSTSTPAEVDLTIANNGGLVQPFERSGLVKATLYVDPTLPASQYIVSCYNGITGSSEGNCGFSVTRNSVGVYNIELGFPVLNRPVVATGNEQEIYLVVFKNNSSLQLQAVSELKDVRYDTRFSLVVF